MSRRPPAVVVGPTLAFLVLAGCSSPRLSGNDGAPDRAAPAAVVAGRPVSRLELCDFWFERYRESYRRTVEDLVDERLVRVAAERGGVRVPPPILDRAVDAEVKARETQLRGAYGEKADLAAAVKEAYGVDVAAWRTTILRPRLESHLLLARVARLDAVRRPLVRAKVIATDDPAKAARLREKLATGADFSLTALRESIDPSAPSGGELPPILEGDTAWPGVERALFAAAEGALVGPLEVQVGGRRQWHLYRVARRRDPWPEQGLGLLDRLERDLAQSPIEPWEVERWRERARREAAVVLYAPDGTALPPAAR